MNATTKERQELARLRGRVFKELKITLTFTADEFASLWKHYLDMRDFLRTQGKAYTWGDYADHIRYSVAHQAAYRVRCQHVRREAERARAAGFDIQEMDLKS